MREELYGTRLYINCKKLQSNIHYFKSILNKSKIIAMVKANAYGFGDVLMAKKMEEFGVDYFGVADFDEGIRLRNNGIQSPIMVMNTSKSSLQTLVEFKLEPVIYSMDLLKSVIEKIDHNLFNNKNEPYPIHIKINTGMNRWGFDNNEVPALIEKLQIYSNHLYIKSIYSHFPSAKNPVDNSFTLEQLDNFLKIYSVFQESFEYSINQHIHNSFGLINFPRTTSCFNYSRLGLALYGLLNHPHLFQIGELKCRISQVRDLQINETVGYDRLFIAKKPMKIATIPFGYADGLQRGWGNGKLKFYYKGCLLPTVGSISMDSCSIDVTPLFYTDEIIENSSLVNEEVIYFGKDRSIWTLSKELNTIPYEIVASLSRRIKRVYN